MYGVLYFLLSEMHLKFRSVIITLLNIVMFLPAKTACSTLSRRQSTGIVNIRLLTVVPFIIGASEEGDEERQIHAEKFHTSCN